MTTCVKSIARINNQGLGMKNDSIVSDMKSVWPKGGLESVPKCPVCGSTIRKLIHEKLIDYLFCAPGKWDIFQCELCTSAYLDSRPTAGTIDLAYQGYFTHNEIDNPQSLSFIGKLRKRFANGYRNHQFGTRDYPASVFGVLIANLMPNSKAISDAGMRHLPKVKNGGRLLDMGCGNGAFLIKARSAGWNVIGVDFDVDATKVARTHGFDIRLGGIEEINPTTDQFDVITLAHVIEHVHNPIEVLRACYRLLKPGGFLWLETPNISSEGHLLFGANWRGLEPPRHLVLFTPKSMYQALSEAGFTEIKNQPYRPLCNDIFTSSVEIMRSASVYEETRRNTFQNKVKKSEKREKNNPERREFITVKAWK